MASLIACTCTLMLTNAPGQNALLVLANWAFALTVPEAESTIVSTKLSLPIWPSKFGTGVGPGTPSEGFGGRSLAGLALAASLDGPSLGGATIGLPPSAGGGADPAPPLGLPALRCAAAAAAFAASTVSGNTARTVPSPRCKIANTSCKLRCGRLNVTAIGSNCVMVTNGV